VPITNFALTNQTVIIAESLNLLLHTKVAYGTKRTDFDFTPLCVCASKFIYVNMCHEHIELWNIISEYLNALNFLTNKNI
jgi:hypothetical protein